MVNKWLIILIILVGIAGIIYGINATITVSNTAKIKENQDYIIKTLNESEETRQQNKIAILNNMSATIVGNQKVIMNGQKNTLNNLTRAIENISHIMQDIDNETDLVKNLTVQLADAHKQFAQTGNISSFDRPLVIQ